MAGVSFTPESFDKMIERHGYKLTHSRAMRCPCMNQSTGQPDPNCSFCVNGWQYYDETEIRGVISGVTTERQFLDTGGMLIGSVMLTVKADVELGYHDRIVAVDSMMNFSELIVRGDAGSDSLRFTPLDINRVVGLSGVVYAPTTDYQNAGTNIIWSVVPEVDWALPGVPEWRGPDAGVFYSIAYQMRPIWIVLQHPHQVRDSQIKFRTAGSRNYRQPVQALARLQYLCED